MTFRWENFFNATMAFAKATSRSVIGSFRLPRPCGLGLVALRTVLLAGPRPCQGRGRGFESLRPLQDLTDFTMVGRCAQGNIWGNSGLWAIIFGWAQRNPKDWVIFLFFGGVVAVAASQSHIT